MPFCREYEVISDLVICECAYMYVHASYMYLHMKILHVGNNVIFVLC